MLSQIGRKKNQKNKNENNNINFLKNAHEVSRSIQEKKNSQMRHFEKVLELCYRAIKQSADMSYTHCIFEVPEFLIGHPIYDINECIVYILRKLQENEYQVAYYFPRTIYIVWFIEETEDEKINKQLLKVLNSIQVKHHSEDIWSKHVQFQENKKNEENENNVNKHNNLFLSPSKMNQIQQWNDLEPLKDSTIKEEEKDVRSFTNIKKNEKPHYKSIGLLDSNFHDKQSKASNDILSIKSKKNIEKKEKTDNPIVNEIDKLFLDAKHNISIDEKSKDIYNLENNKTEMGNENNNEKNKEKQNIEPKKRQKGKKQIKNISELKNNSKFILDLS